MWGLGSSLEGASPEPPGKGMQPGWRDAVLMHVGQGRCLGEFLLPPPLLCNVAHGDDAQETK